MKTGVTINGIEDVARVLREALPKDARNISRSLVRAAAGEIAKKARDLAPKGKTGKLKKGIKALNRNPHGKDEFQSDVVVQGAYYWRFLEYGQGPDGIEHAFILRALNHYKANQIDIDVKAAAKVMARRARRRLNKG